MRNIFFIFSTFALLSTSIAQSPIIDQYVQEALSNNLTVKGTRLLTVKQQSKIDQAAKLWKPNVDLSASYLLAEGGRNLLFPIGDLFNPAYATLNQLTGTERFPTDLENVKTQLTPNNFVDAQISISKPIINSSIKYNKLIQQELLKINQVDEILTKQDITYQVKTSYYNYLKSIEGINIMKQNQQLLNEVLEFNKKLVKYNKATSEILSDVEIQIANLQSQEVMLSEQQALAKALFNLLLNKPLDSDITVDATLINDLQAETLSLEPLTQQALNNRQELKKILIAQEVNELNKKRVDKSKLPTVGVNAGVGLQTEDFNFDEGGALYTAAVGVSWKIVDGGLRKKQLEELSIDQEILNNNSSQIKQSISIQVLQSYLGLQSQLSQMTAKQIAVESADNSYKIIKTRYENDRALLIELLNAQNQLTNGQLSLIITKYDYLIQLALLHKALAK